MPEVKKRKAVYDKAAQDRWTAKNKETRARINRKSTAKRFLSQDADLDELDQMQAYIDERRRVLHNVTSESDIV